jgi:NAD-dependent deacetylase
MSTDDPTHQLAEALRAGGPTLVLTGAGISLASGIPTFRGTDAGAVWAANVMTRATRQHFVEDPADSWTWYRERHARVLTARPNPAHRALVDLERWHAARGHPFRLVTQNIDLLHEAAGSRALVKVHGSIDRARCSAASCPAAATTVPAASLDFRAFDARPDAAAVPRCPVCGALMRPHVLWFDEHYGSHPDYGWPAVLEACDTMRLVVAVGTSFSVGVTDLIAGEAGRRGIPLFVVDPQGASIEGRGIVSRGLIGLRDKAEDVLPRVCAMVGARA